MLNAVNAADDRLEAAFVFGTALFGLGYDLNANGGTFTFVEGGTGGPSDPGDHFQVGFFFDGYWSYWISGGQFDYNLFSGGTATYSSPTSSLWSGVTWDEAPVGLLDRVLSDGSWDGLRFAPAFVASAPQQPVSTPIPEPTSALLVVFGTLFALRRRSLLQ